MPGGGPLYDEFHTAVIDTSKVEVEIKRLMMDDDVTDKKGIYPFVLTRIERYLAVRAFSEAERTEAYERQNGIYPIYQKHFEITEMEADHITTWSIGGKTNSSNCQMLCAEDNRRKSAT